MGRHQVSRLLVTAGVVNALAHLIGPLSADRMTSGSIYLDRVADILSMIAHQRDPVIVQSLSARNVLKGTRRKGHFSVKMG